MKILTLTAQKRFETQNKVKQLRIDKKIPAVLYGHGFGNQNLTLNYLDFEKIHKALAGSGMVDLVIDNGAPIKVLLQDYQLNPLTSRFDHVDLRQVRMDEKIKTEVKLNFINESPAVKELGGMLVKPLSSVHVECLPQDLVSEINVDVSGLAQFGQTIHLKDLVAPSGVKIIGHDSDVVVSATEIKVEEEAPVVVATAVDVTQIKTEGEIKKEEKAAKESAEAAAKE